MPLVLRVGLTGGIGSGKSTVAARLAERGAVVVDADRIARELVEPGQPALAALVEAFGAWVLRPDGTLDRSALGKLVFSDDAALLRLNAIMHPRIEARCSEAMAAVPREAIVVHDMPLLVEHEQGSDYHLVVVVGVPADERVRRLVSERGMTAEDAWRRVRAQAGEGRQRAAADVWLDNTGPRRDVLVAVDRLWDERLVPFEANLQVGRPAPAPEGPVRYDPQWPEQAARLAGRVVRAVGDDAAGDDAAGVAHIGSTAVPGLAGADVIDLLVLVPAGDGADVEALRDRLAAAGFPRDDTSAEALARDGGGRVHVTADPGRAARVWVRATGEPSARSAVLLRDWLRAHDAERDAYAAVKAAAAATGAERYRAAKHEWLGAALARAEAWAAGAPGPE